MICEVRTMENFLNLPLEKQNTIINAALICFGTNGYKKASVNDIASAAGISKAMVFHYFGTKKALYFYLFEICGNTIIDAMNKTLDKGVTDFFDRVLQAAKNKMDVLKKHPAIFTFLNSVYFEKDEEVAAEVKALFSKGEEVRSEVALTGMDMGKFKDGVDPQLVLKVLTWVSEGYLSELPKDGSFNIETMSEVFEECLKLFKNNFYKEEYL
jgi:TetR/AcrR family transcriptional regulator